MLYIFDWDGTLCNSLNKIVGCTRAAAEEVGVPVPTEADVREIIGLSLPRAIQQIFPGLSHADFQTLMAAYARHFTADRASVIDFYPGVRETLDQLLESGHQIAVATGKGRRGLDRVLREMEMVDYFHGSRCADETASKPDPRMLNELLEEFSLTPEQAVMIGDTEFDMAMARAIDMPRIAVSYGAHAVDRLKDYEPVLCVDGIDGVLEWRP